MEDDGDGFVTMHCGECGEPMLRRPDGAWVGCCNRLGYWADVVPLPRDAWMPIHRTDGRQFYRTSKWPAGLAPAEPRIYA